jgi:hypothetical protein
MLQEIEFEATAACMHEFNFEAARAHRRSRLVDHEVN